MPASDFRPGTGDTVDHEFADGKVALLRRTLPKWELIRSGKLNGALVEQLDALTTIGSVTDPSLAVDLLDVIVTSMWVEPRVTTDAAAVAYDASPQVVHIGDIEAYIDETIEAALGGARDAARFREDPARARVGADGADVVDVAEPAAELAAG